MNRFLFPTLLAVGGLYFAVGCTSTVTGNEGNLDFSYVADDDITNFNKPIAVGAKLELNVFETGTRTQVEVQTASSDDEEVLAVETFSGNSVILTGTGEGSALIEVSANAPGKDAVTDSVNMLAAVPDTLTLKHPCDGGDSAKYLTGTEDVHILFEMAKDNGQPVIGYGYFPFEVEPAGLVTLNEESKNQAAFRFDIGTETGEVQLSSTLDDTTLVLDITTEAAIDGISATNSDPVEVRVDQTSIAGVIPTVGGVPVCASNAQVTAETSTPEICSVRAIEPLGVEGVASRTGGISIEGKAFGICKYTVTYTNAAEGAGVSAEYDAEVGEFPDADGTE